jgi:hypothetical protein
VLIKTALEILFFVVIHYLSRETNIQAKMSLNKELSAFFSLQNKLKLKQTINSEKKNVAHENLEFAPYADCGGTSGLARRFCQH